MVNQSKKNDLRFWKIWEKSGAIGNLKDASVRSEYLKNFPELGENHYKLMLKVSRLERGLEERKLSQSQIYFGRALIQTYRTDGSPSTAIAFLEQSLDLLDQTNSLHQPHLKNVYVLLANTYRATNQRDKAEHINELLQQI